jgi:L-ascorbate metabolism protein UlaG (beta-lactamase superfamily)
MNYPEIEGRFTPDLIAVTHGHDDHSHTTPWPNVPVVHAGEAAPTDSGVNVTWLDCAHDAFEGTTRGGRTGVLRLVLDDVAVVHTGDLGELPEPDVLDALRPCNLLLVSCGGYFTLGPAEACELSLRLSADSIMPMHFATDYCDLVELAGTGGMTARLPVSDRRAGSWRYIKGTHSGLVLIGPAEP